MIENALQAIREISANLKCHHIVIYPFAHLSSKLANPSIAKQLLEKLKIVLEKEGYTVHRAPFGWYKMFELKCAGHPLAESFREFN